MTRILSILAVVLMATSFAFAQNGKMEGMKHGTAKMEKMTYSGYLMDKMCAEAHKDDMGEMAKTHTTECALKCKASGFGMVSDGKWYSFDTKGQSKAAAILKKTKTDKGVMVEVVGTANSDTITVSSIKEVSTPAM